MTEEQKPTGAQNQVETDSPVDDQGVTFDSDDIKEDARQTDEQTHTEEDAEQEKTYINQEAVQKKINKVTAERYEEKRKREEAEAKLKELEAKQNEKIQTDIVIPEMPDAFDPLFEEKLKNRDEALRQQALQQAQRDFEKKTAEREAQERAEKDRKTVKSFVDSMYEGGEKLGIKAEELKQADDRVAMFIKDPGIARFIISHDKAPLIVKHLSESIEELEKISQMSPIDAAVYIATDIVPKAQNFKPTLPQTPDPLDIPGGRAAGEKKDPFLESVTFE